MKLYVLTVIALLSGCLGDPEPAPVLPEAPPNPINEVSVPFESLLLDCAGKKGHPSLEHALGLGCTEWVGQHSFLFESPLEVRNISLAATHVYDVGGLHEVTVSIEGMVHNGQWVLLGEPMTVGGAPLGEFPAGGQEKVQFDWEVNQTIHALRLYFQGNGAGGWIAETQGALWARPAELQDARLSGVCEAGIVQVASGGVCPTEAIHAHRIPGAPGNRTVHFEALVSLEQAGCAAALVGFLEPAMTESLYVSTDGASWDTIGWASGIGTDYRSFSMDAAVDIGRGGAWIAAGPTADSVATCVDNQPEYDGSYWRF